jgi:fatty-acyl-CoA synthase
MTDVAASYVHGAASEPLLSHTIGKALERAAAAWSDRTALVSRAQGLRWTWAELKERVDAFAAGLLGLGLRRGDRIGIWSLNRAEWALTQFAAARAGLILVTINPAYRLSELEFALNKVGCNALVTATAFKTSDYIGMLNTLAPELAAAPPGKLSAARLPQLRTVIQVGGPRVAGTIAFDDVAALGGEAERAELRKLAGHLQFDDAANIQFTSGTTGSPKGVTLTHHNILNNGYFVGRAMGLTAADRICIPVPLYHCFGMVMGNLAAVSHGSAMVYPGEGFDPLATLETVEAERCTALYGVPTMFIAELDHPAFVSFDLKSLRTGIMAGAPCPIEVMRRVAQRMNMREVTIAYGMTETSPVSFQSAVDDPLERRVTTVGRIHPHLEVKIVDAEGRIVPRGQSGELCTRGYSVMLGYWDDAEKTAEVIDAARWMHTGDLATMDAEG